MANPRFTMDYYIEQLENAVRRNVPNFLPDFPNLKKEPLTEKEITGIMTLLLINRQPFIEKIIKDISSSPEELTVFEAVKNALDAQSGDSIEDIEASFIYTELLQILEST